MSDWQDRQADAREDLLLVFGEEVGLPSGVFTAVVELGALDTALAIPGTRTGQPLPMEHQQAPGMFLAQADAADLREQDPVTIRGEQYLVVKLYQDGAGFTRADLMRPGAEPGPRPEWNQWR